MTNIIKAFFGLKDQKQKEVKTRNDFSEFFSKSSGDKAKVIRQVLREANAEQRKLMEKAV